MTTYKIKRFSRFTKLELEDLKNELPSEYLALQRMSLDPNLKVMAKKATYLKESEFEFPYFEMIPIDTAKKEDYQSSWKLPICYVDNLQTPIYFNFKKGIWENFQGREIINLKSYLFMLWNSAFEEWEERKYDEYLNEKEDIQFKDYTWTLLKMVKRYLV